MPDAIAASRTQPEHRWRISTKIAALGGPPVIIETKPAAKAAASAKPDKGAIKKRQDAQRAIKRRRIALRARLAAQAAEQSSTRPPYH